MKKVRKIYFKLGGGLGNQIFQYAAVKSIANRQGSQPIFDIRGLENAHHGQKSLITNLDFPENFSSSYVRMLFWRILLRITKNRINTRQKIGIYVASTLGYEDLGDLDLHRFRYLEGFFITHKFLLELQSSKLLLEISPKNPTSWFLEQLELIQDKRVCGIHIRRGDYLLSWQDYGILGEAYYRDAILNLSSDSQVEEFWIFTDSPIPAEKLMQSCDLKNYRIVDQPKDANDAESLVLLSNCEYIICANSTFSMSAAIFSEAKEIIVPDIFYRNIPMPSELYLESWVRVKSNWISLDEAQD
jgi:hypothetical protein